MKISRIWLFLALVLFLVFLFLVLRQEIELPVSVKAQNKIVKINKGEGAVTIAKKLEEQGIIKNKHLFLFYVFLTGEYKELKAGVYSLSSCMTISEIVSKMVKGETAEERVTIPEGFNIKKIENRIEAQLGRDIDIASFTVDDYRSRFPFLQSAPTGISLEGFLFPDTYYFEPEANAEEIVSQMLTRFEQKALPLIPRKNIFQLITMASLLEKEVKSEQEMRTVAGILWKRLEEGIPLQVDATINYITGKNTAAVSVSETKIESPYNTYINKGLPLGPICSPGLKSIRAVLSPAKTDYWYYLTAPGTGETIFSKTFEEHKQAKEKYLK